MSTIIEQVKDFFISWKPDSAVEEVKQLAQAGSDRQYFRVRTPQRSYIVTYNCNIPENNAFFEFTRHFHNKQLAVPEIYHVSAEKCFYIKPALGEKSFFEIIKSKEYPNHPFDLYKKPF